MNPSATDIDLVSSHIVGDVDPRLFGGFIEHMGRCVYEGVYEPDSPHADETGLRRDVLAAIRDLGISVIRYPGGNFASGYHFSDGIGPLEARPRVRELAWQSLEVNQFGTHEFMRLCELVGCEAMLTVNLGTGTPEEARNWVEYCTAPPGTRWADLRAENGRSEPWQVPLWCLGNEMDGPWQLGHVPAREYAIRARQAAKMMRDCTPGIRLIACGSSSPEMNTFAEWDRETLETIGGLADYVSLHRYIGNPSGDTANYLAIGNSIDAQIEAIDATCRYVQAKRKRRKRAYLSFDEWNVWYKARGGEHQNGRGQFAPHLIEEIYNLEDALAVSEFLHSFLRHADVVRIANLAQLVNVIAPILTTRDDLLRQSIYWPFRAFARHARGDSLAIGQRGPRYESADYGEATAIDASATLDQGQLSVFLTNRTDSEQAVRIRMLDRKLEGAHLWAAVVTAPEAKAANSFAEREVVGERPFAGAQCTAAGIEARLPPLSFVHLHVPTAPGPAAAR